MKKYSLTELILKAMEQYKMEPKEKDDYSTSRVPGKYRQKFLDYLKKTTAENGKSLLDNAIDTEYKRDNNKERYFFTEEEVHNIIFSSEIHEYCIKWSVDESIKNALSRRQIEQEIKEESERYLQFLKDNDLPYEPYVGYVLSFEEAGQEMNRLMITELFELFFTPIDASYITDRNNASFYGGDTANAESIAATRRLRRKENYYQFNPDNPRLNKILDMLADKIAERIANKN